MLIIRSDGLVFCTGSHVTCKPNKSMELYMSSESFRKNMSKHFKFRFPYKLQYHLYKQLFPIYRFKSDEERTPVHHIVEQTFPNLQNIFSKLVQIENPRTEVADLIKLICKIFWCLVYVRVIYLYTYF